MATYKVAHLRANDDENIIITMMNPAFGEQPPEEQKKIWEAFQACAVANKLTGTVVPVWDVGNGQLKYLAPKKFHQFLNTLTPNIIEHNMNRIMEA